MAKRVKEPWWDWIPADNLLFGYSILMVDDEKHIRDHFEQYLQSLGAKVICVSEGFEAFEKTKEWTPDLAIVDYVMPSISGLELVERWRDSQRSIKVIMFSGRKKSAGTGLEAGQLGVAA